MLVGGGFFSERIWGCLHALVALIFDDLSSAIVLLVESGRRASPAGVEISYVLIKLGAVEGDSLGFKLVLFEELMEVNDAVEVGIGLRRRSRSNGSRLLEHEPDVAMNARIFGWRRRNPF